MPDSGLPTPPPATRAHMAEARRELEAALSDPKAKKQLQQRLRQTGKRLVKDLESDIRRIEDGRKNGNGTNGAHP